METRVALRTSEWPYNFLQAMEMGLSDPLDALDDSGTMEVAMSLARLTPREKNVLRMMFAQGKTLKEIGEDFGVTAERVRQVEARSMRKMRGSKDAKFVISHGVKAYVDARVAGEVEVKLESKKKELEAAYRAKLILAESESSSGEVRPELLQMPIEELGLSVRAYNCMRRAACHNVGDFLQTFPTQESAKSMTNLGSKSMSEIRMALAGIGIKWPVGDM